MPYYDMKCPSCGWTVEKFAPVSDVHPVVKVECRVCDVALEVLPTISTKRVPFKAFTTTHVNGKPIEIDSITKLRQVEKGHKVNFPAFGGSMLGDSGMKETHWVDSAGKTHRE